MLVQRLILSLINASTSFAGELPSWITNPRTSDSIYYYVQCSSEAIDPQDATSVAEGKCLSSASKLAGVTVTVNSKTILSLTGSDASDTVELTPIKKDVNCEWTNKYVEKLEATHSFRVWLECRVSKSSVNSSSGQGVQESPIKRVNLAYKRAIITLIIVPRADVIIVGGSNGERAIEVNSNTQQIELTEYDEWIIAKKHGYKEVKKPVSFQHGDMLSEKLTLIRDF